MNSLAPNDLLNQDKLKQVILYFIHTANNDTLGKTKLMKLLYYADFDHFEEHDAPITGARYEKWQHGPVPSEAWATLEAMEREGIIDVQEVPCFDYVRTRYTAHQDVDRSVFTDEEWATLEAVRSRFQNWTTRQIVSATHGEAPWVAVRMREDIPYELAYYRNTHGEMSTADDWSEDEDQRPTEDEIFARELVTA